MRSTLVSTRGFACFGSWIKERVIFMCSVLVLVHGLKNEGYSCVARLFRFIIEQQRLSNRVVIIIGTTGLREQH